MANCPFNFVPPAFKQFVSFRGFIKSFESKKFNFERLLAAGLYTNLKNTTGGCLDRVFNLDVALVIKRHYLKDSLYSVSRRTQHILAAGWITEGTVFDPRYGQELQPLLFNKCRPLILPRGGESGRGVKLTTLF